MDANAATGEGLARGGVAFRRRALPWLAHGARIALGLVFLVAGVLKMIDPAEFAHQIVGYGIIGPELASLAAPLLIAFEVALGVALLAGFRCDISAPVAAALLIAFIGIEVYGISTGRTAACGCFGAYLKRTPEQVIGEDLLFLGFAVLTWFLLRAWRPRSAGRATMSVAITAAVSLGLAVASPHLPIDAYVTGLSTGTPVGELGIPMEVPSLEEGRHVVAIFDVTSPDASQLSDRLNDLTNSADGPRIVALTPSSDEEKTAIFWAAVPDFDIYVVDRPVLKRLYRRLPLFFTVESGRVTGIYDDAGRATADLLSSEGS